MTKDSLVRLAMRWLSLHHASQPIHDDSLILDAGCDILSRMASEETIKKRTAVQLIRLMLAGRDFQYALSAATFLLGDVDWGTKYSLADMRRFHCYEATMVISCARPFTQSRGASGPFAWKHAGVKLSADEKALHKKLLEHRNKLYAHSDTEFVEMRKFVLRTELGEDKTFDYVMPRFDEGLRFRLQELETAEQLLRRACAAVSKAVQQVPASHADFTILGMG